MLQVKTEVKPSTIAGVGLFAAKFIPRGTLIWKFSQEWDYQFRINTGAFTRLSVDTKESILKFAWIERASGFLIYPVDDAKYFNHSDTPNTVCDPFYGRTTAIRDINLGEEITCNYSEFEDHQEDGIHGLSIDTPNVVFEPFYGRSIDTLNLNG